MLPSRLKSDAIFRPQHRNRCYCQMRDKWCPTTPTARLDDDRTQRSNSIFTHTAALALHASKSHEEQEGLMTTSQRLAYDTLHTQLQLNESTAVTSARPEKTIVQAPIYLAQHPSFVDLNEIRAYRNLNPSNCHSSRSLSCDNNPSRSIAVPLHQCQVRYRLNALQESVPCHVNAAGHPLCTICGQAFDRNTATPLAFAGRSHQLHVLKSDERIDYTKPDDEKPSLILEIHDYGQNRDLELSNRNRQLLNIRITKKITPPNSLALRHQRQH